VWLANPRWRLPCAVCVKYQYTADGELMSDPESGKPMLRGDGETPCSSCPKVPDTVKAMCGPAAEMRAAAWEMTPQQRDALDHYYRMKAVQWPEPSKSDPVCQWYAGIFCQTESELADVRAAVNERIGDTLTMVFTLLTRRR